MNSKESIQLTKQGFEESFKTGAFYNKQTQDETHLQQILDWLPQKSGMRILDLGTGTGYLAFPVAMNNQDCSIIGLDIVEAALEQNRNRAKEQEITNLTFQSYDGEHFPFDNETFDLVITRYALHHFPVIADTFYEIFRVL